MNRHMTALAIVLAFLIAPVLSAQQQPAGPTPPQTSQTQIDQYVVGQARPPEVPGSSMLDMTLDQAMQIALEKNLDLKVQRMEPVIQDYTLQGLRAAYRPTFTGSYGYSNNTSTSTRQLDCGTRLTNSSNSYQSSMQQRLPWYGSNFSVGFTNGRSATNDACATKNPAFSSRLNMNFTQPLLTNFKIDTDRNSLRTAPIQRQVTDINLQIAIENLKARVRQSYWALRQRIEAIEIQKRSLELARRQFEDSKIRVEIGTMAPIDTTQFEVGVVSQEQSLLNAEITWRTAELALKQLLASGPDDDVYKATINPVDRPRFEIQSVDIQAAVQNAIATRTDIEVSRKNLQVSEFDLDLRKNALMPTLNLQANYSLQGTGGPTLVRQGQAGPVIETLPGGYADALKSLFGIDTPSWSMTFNFSYPLGQVSQKVALAQAEIRLDQARTRIEAQKLSISTAVTNAGLAVQNTFKQLEQAQKNRQVQERNTEAARIRFDVGLANAFEVASALNSLTNSRLNELNATINYLNAIAEFEKVQRVQ
jgi:outer membrane protein TolC